jgi:LemA protein
MNTRNLTLIIIVGLILVLGGCGCNSYNTLVNKDENVKAKWSAVQSDYQRRADLIPNLVNTVKGAANFEQETLTRVIEARAKATQVTLNPGELTPENIQKFQAAQGELSSSLSRLLVSVERYPELKANQNFLDLQKQLEGTENRINVSRKDFNTSVQDYNSSVRKFPANIFAGMFGFGVKEGFTADAGAERAPQVQF